MKRKHLVRLSSDDVVAEHNFYLTDLGLNLKDKLAKLAEKVICGPDDDAALTEEIRQEQEADKKEGNR